MMIRLYVRLRLPNGTRRCADPVFAANGKLKPFYVRIDHQPQHTPEGVYHIRFPICFCICSKPATSGIHALG
jgi:hypothetical protein